MSKFHRKRINRNFNKIVKELKPKEIILEKLNFSNSKLSKSMNRMLSKCGRSVIRSKLIMIQEDFGIKVTEVNPAYSSQTCNKCGFVHKNNRNKRDTFKCKICNYKKHADITASREIRLRSSYPIFGSRSEKKIIKKHLFEQFRKNILQCGDKSRNTNAISPDRRAIFLENDPKTFNEFYGLLKSRNKSKICKIET